MELSLKSLDEIGYWSAVVLKGLEDQSRLLKRAEPLIDRMGADEFVAHRNSAHSKIYRAVKEGSIHPLRELKTLEKGVLVRDFQFAKDIFLSFVP